MKVKKKDLKIAIVHDYLRTFGGGERVLLALHDIWPAARIFVATADYRRMGQFGKRFKKLGIVTSGAQKIPLFVKKPLLYRFLLPIIWSSVDVGDVDVVISSSGSNIAKGIRIPKGVVHVCYCHTPPRFLYGIETETNYLEHALVALLVKPLLSVLRSYDQKTSQNVDLFLANSKNVRERIRKFYNRDSQVIYPPCKIPSKTTSDVSKNFYLSVGRLTKYKNVDLVVSAFNVLNLPLKIIGDGEEASKLKKIAKPNIEFLGEISDQALINNYKECKALVVAATNEDFGISAVEAQGYGKPVIAYLSGGYNETVIDGKTGVFFKNLTAEDLIDGVRRFETMDFKRKVIWENASRFSENRFKEAMKAMVLAAYKINVGNNDEKNISV